MTLHYPWQSDTRSEATKQQQSLFQQLGTLYRLQANLANQAAATTSKLRSITYECAHQAVALDILDVRYAMTQLPNKKRVADKLAELNKQQVNQPKEKYEP